MPAPVQPARTAPPATPAQPAPIPSPAEVALRQVLRQDARTHLARMFS